MKIGYDETIPVMLDKALKEVGIEAIRLSKQNDTPLMWVSRLLSKGVTHILTHEESIKRLSILMDIKVVEVEEWVWGREVEFAVKCVGKLQDAMEAERLQKAFQTFHRGKVNYGNKETAYLGDGFEGLGGRLYSGDGIC